MTDDGVRATQAGFEVIGGGTPTSEEAAAIAAALAVVLAQDPAPPPSDRWRWSGRAWQRPSRDWRDPGSTAHPSFP